MRLRYRDRSPRIWQTPKLNSTLAGHEVIQCELAVDEAQPPAEHAVLEPSL